MLVLDSYALQFSPDDKSWNQERKQACLLAHQWLQQCQSTHEKCTKSSLKSLPTRLIDLDDSEHPRLIRGSTLDSSTEYATLSHCWGSQEPLTLQRDNLTLFSQCIPLDKLPRLHREVFEVVVSLGLRYLWIDNLCIVQDSKADWAAEAAIMDQVYENSTVTIAAANAKDSSESLYAERDARCKEYSRPIRMCVDGVIADYFAIEEDIASYNFQHSVLNKRAWVLQELVLSRRVIYFCKEQVFWRCSERQSCELFPEGLPIRNYGAYIPNPYDCDMLEAWPHILCLYTSAQLSHPDKDKLVALSGLAKRTHDSSDYYAGLWASQFPWNLLWRVDSDQQKSEVLHTLEAPSWSWSAVYSPTIHRHAHWDGHFVSLCKILQCHVSQHMEDRTGDVRSGLLKLRGYVLKTKLRQTNTESPNNAKWYSAASPETILNDLHLDTSIVNETETYYLFIVGFKDRGKDLYTTFAGLMLQHTGNEGEYRRVGVFEALHLWTPKETPRVPVLIHGQGSINLAPNEFEFLQKFESFSEEHILGEVRRTCSWSDVKLPPGGNPSASQDEYRDSKVCEIDVV